MVMATKQVHSALMSRKWSPSVGMTQRVELEFILYLRVSEFLTTDVNEMFSAHHGCAAHRFRCPHSLFSPLFAIRQLVAYTGVVFNVTPYMPFPLLALIVLAGTSCTRLAGLLVYDVEPSTGG